jgi:anti-sigma regulatory factor (Ser/Thr protein kinase)
MRSDKNRIIFDRTLKADFLNATAAIYNIIEKQKYQDITLDFSQTFTFYPEYMVPLVTMCRSYRMKRIDFDVILPADVGVSAHFSNTNWGHLIAPEKFEPKVSKFSTHMPAKQYFTADEHHKIVDNILDVILQSIKGIDRNRLKALEWALSEIMDNVLNHAQSEIGGIVQISALPKQKRVEFFVCDAGVTIPRSLRLGRPDLKDDTSALHAAIQEGVTSNKVTNQGNGLFGTFKCCEVSAGEFDIMSGSVFLKHNPEHTHVGRSLIPFSGTYVRASIGYDFERLLERALVFRGRPHNPPHDYIERKYETESNRIEFYVAKEIEAFGSRSAGQYARNKIDVLMNNRSQRIVFDFSDVHLISSSFADEVFGKIFAELGPITFSHICQFRNVDSTVKALIDRAISQRMRIT